MVLSELAQKNEKILQRALKVKELLKKQETLNINVEECNDAVLFYTIISTSNAQTKAPLGEKFLCNKLKLKRVQPSENRGDAYDSNNKYYEFKNSFTNKGNTLNLRQIRLWQDIDYYYCVFINEDNLDDSLFFVLTKEQMMEEIILCNAGYTHGTIEANLNNVNKEYSITLPIYNDNNANTKRWKEKYLSQEFKKKILYGN